MLDFRKACAQSCKEALLARAHPHTPALSSVRVALTVPGVPMLRDTVVRVWLVCVKLLQGTIAACDKLLLCLTFPTASLSLSVFLSVSLCLSPPFYADEEQAVRDTLADFISFALPSEQRLQTAYKCVHAQRVVVGYVGKHFPESATFYEFLARNLLPGQGICSLCPSPLFLACASAQC